MTTGIIFINTGTPDAPEVSAVQTYLRLFLSDRRIVNIPPLIWKPILNTFVLRARPKKTVAIYKSIWTDAGSPYTVYSCELERKLQDALHARYGTEVVAALAHNYGNPSVTAQLQRFQQQGVDKLVVMPLYPQQAFSTTYAAHDELERAMQALGWQPQTEFVWDYYQNEQWVSAVAASIAAELERLPQGTTLLFSYHSIPLKDTRNGDKYVQQVEASCAAIGAKLDAAHYELAFQSRFDDAQRWHGPFIGATLARLEAQDVRDVLIATPNFAVDCTETLYDLAIKERAAHPTLNLHIAPCLNATDAHVQALLSCLPE